MAEEEAAQVEEEEPAANAEADVDPEAAETNDAFDERAAELTGPDGADADAPIADINRDEVDAASNHLGDSNLDGDRDTLKRLQKEM